MKKNVFLLALFTATTVYAQDVIVKKDGSTIISKVLEVSTSDIKYKKYSNLDGPLYTIGISDVLSINYENGEKELFENSNANNEKQIEILNNVTEQKEYTLNSGTLIPIQNANYTRAAYLRLGQTVQFRVARDVEVNGIKIIPYGTSVRGNVYEVKKSSWFGTKGRLGISFNEIVLPNGVTIPLKNGNLYVTGKNRTPLSVLLFLLVTWPACFITGSKAELPAGYEITAEIARPVVFYYKDGALESKVSENTISIQDGNIKKKGVIKKSGRYSVKATDITEDSNYYYYKLASKPNGRTYKVKKSKVGIIFDVME